MFGKRFPRQRAGRPIEARTLNLPIAEVERASRLGVAPPLEMQSTANGSWVRYAGSPGIWAKITAGTNPGPYAFTEQLTTSGGGWSDGFLNDHSGADPAYNSVDGVTLTLPVIVRMERGSDGSWRFSAGAC